METTLATTPRIREIQEKLFGNGLSKRPAQAAPMASTLQAVAAQTVKAAPARPVAPARVETQFDRDAAERAERFRSVYRELESALPWIRQPRKASNITFENYEASTPEQAKALKASQAFATRLMKRVITGKNPEVGILFLGFSGTGKTHLAKAILSCLRAQQYPGFFLPASEYFDLYTPSYAAGLDRPLWKIRQWLASTSCLVIDEVGTASWTDARKDRLQQIIDLRTENKLPTVITTNLTQADLASAGAERIASRFDQVLYPISCTWDDFRKRKSTKAKAFDEVF